VSRPGIPVAGRGEQPPYAFDRFPLAQLNVVRLAAPLDSAQLADFVAGLEPVNAAAEAAPGFVWRLKDDPADNATSFSIKRACKGDQAARDVRDHCPRRLRLTGLATHGEGL
jgi:hypothetical protein